MNHQHNVMCTVIGAPCSVCRKNTLQVYTPSVERIDAHTIFIDNENYTLQCEECKSIECSVETFLDLVRS